MNNRKGTRLPDTCLQFQWQNFNPTKFPLKIHIGIPPVIGSDGIIYGVYEILDFAPIDITPPNENMEWTTEVAVPDDASGFYILLSVESRKPRTYIDCALDITDKYELLHSRLRAILITYCNASILNAHIGSPHSPLNPQVILRA